DWRLEQLGRLHVVQRRHLQGDDVATQFFDVSGDHHPDPAEPAKVVQKGRAGAEVVGGEGVFTGEEAKGTLGDGGAPPAGLRADRCRLEGIRSSILRLGGESGPTFEAVRALSEACDERVSVRFAYIGRAKEPSRRAVEPHRRGVSLALTASP